MQGLKENMLNCYIKNKQQQKPGFDTTKCYIALSDNRIISK